FLELSSTLEPDRPATTDKLAIEIDVGVNLASRVMGKAPFGQMPALLSWLYIEMLSEAEKNELREEKLVLKEKNGAAGQINDQQYSTIRLMTPHLAALQAGANKMSIFPY
ncbi:hypothetical protein M8C21_001724, partial [Ambrosia artemisiifolia]